MRDVGPGSPEPLGVTPGRGGANVAVISAHATAIELCLFDASGEREIERVALPERTGDVFHGFVGGVAAGDRYGLRAHGPYDPRAGHRFNAAKLLVDPYARALDRAFAYDPALTGGGGDRGTRDDADSAPFVPKGIVTPCPDPVAPRRPQVPWRETILYELHLRGFTRTHPGVPEALRGTCAGLAHPTAIAHLTRLGVTTVELMPIAAAIDERHLARAGLNNYWGYNPVALFVPDPRLAPGGIDELRACVAALHAAGIEVILDVVFNHTGEGDALGPTVSLRGLDNASYYRTLPDDATRYIDDTGCGNTLALDRAPVLRLALDALRYYAQTAGVDGFRFDLATTLGRRDDGFDPAAPLLQAIAQDPVLRDLKLIAEPWDVGPGGHRLGAFPPGWGEWNDRYRDTVRRFWRGDARAHRRARDALRGLRRRLRATLAAPVAVGQFRHGARWLHPGRSRDLRREAQRGKRRGQPRRQRCQLVVESRRRRADGRPRDRSGARARRAQPARDAAAVAGNADARDGRRARTHPAGQQQRVRAGQPADVDRLGSG